MLLVRGKKKQTQNHCHYGNYFTMHDAKWAVLWPKRQLNPALSLHDKKI